MLHRQATVLAIAILIAPNVALEAAEEFQVTNNGTSSFSIDGEINPTLTFLRDSTYIFHVSAPGHPFWIKTIQSIGTANAAEDGITGNGASQGDVTFTVPNNAASEFFYNCQFHSMMTGSIMIDAVVSVANDKETVPVNFSLYGNFPNPFNPTTTISFSLPDAAHAQLAVFDMQGREIMRLVDSGQDAGYRQIKWDGRDFNGRVMPTGLYIARLATDQTSESIKMVLLK